MEPGTWNRLTNAPASTAPGHLVRVVLGRDLLPGGGRAPARVWGAEDHQPGGRQLLRPRSLFRSVGRELGAWPRVATPAVRSGPRRRWVSARGIRAALRAIPEPDLP